MAEEKNSEEDVELAYSKLEESLAVTTSPAGRPQRKEHGHSFRNGFVKHEVATTVLEPFSFSTPGNQPPGLFMNIHIPGSPVAIKDNPEEIAQFHDSESEDIYDLYNACNGAVREDGLLDVSKLDELTAEEQEIFNVKRLRDIWQHTFSGCPTCAGIVRTLGSVRQIMGEEDFD